jgi:hypothetical protein
MWPVNTLTYEQKLLDFSSAGLGQRRVTSLYADGERLANGLELLEFDAATLQVEVCEDCGIPHCATGGWVSLRRLGSSVLWLPCFDEMGKGGAAVNEYAPPNYRYGSPCFGQGTYAQLRSREPRFPPIDDLRPIRSRDLARLMQLEAPGRALGCFPDQPFLKTDLVVASDHDRPTVLDALERLLLAAWERDVPVAATPSATPVTLFLDLPHTPSWTPLAKRSHGYELYLNGNGLGLES